MNKIVADGKNGKMLLCILEPGNLDRLQHGKPIEFSTHELFPRGLPAHLNIVIAFSLTPIEDSQELEKMLAPEGVKIDQRTPGIQARRPHCPECKSTIEQMGIFSNESPVWLAFCVQCGCTLGTVPPNNDLVKKAEKVA